MFTATGKRSRFYVCRFIDGTTSKHWEPQTTMYAELFVLFEIKGPARVSMQLKRFSLIGLIVLKTCLSHDKVFKVNVLSYINAWVQDCKFKKIY
jgi:hypothetical protein